MIILETIINLNSKIFISLKEETFHDAVKYLMTNFLYVVKSGNN
jgi:hypothetical protein